MSIELHCFGESGNAYKAALTLELAGMDWRPVKVDFFRGATRHEDYLALNPMGEAPVLVEGELRLTQSGVIQDWVVTRTGRFGGPEGEAGRREVLRWLLWDNHKMSSQAGTLRFLMNFLPEEKRPEQVIDWMSGRFRVALKVLEAHLQGRDWIVGDAPSIADFACCGYLYYPENFAFSRADWPAIDAWLDRIAGLPGWKHPYELMPRAFPGAED